MKLLTGIVFLSGLFSGVAIADCPCDDSKQGQATGDASSVPTGMKGSSGANATMSTPTVPPAPANNTSTTATDSTPSADSNPSTDTGASKDN